MCGIAGIFDYRGQREIDRSLLRQMTDTLGHRGPDGDGFHIAPGIGLGHRRLAIIDLVTGDQPLFNETGTVCVVYNGEVYNFQPLMAELKALGHVFHTQSDTEVIVHAWEEWGAGCLDRFNGMFAFALWDAAQEILFLARDRLGEKPLYYSFLSDGRLLFASELKSLLLCPQVDRKLDPQAIEEFFAFGYVPDPRSIYQGVCKLPPAHYMLVRRDEPLAKPLAYWDLRFFEGVAMRREEIEEELIARLRESVRMRMIADVPLGAFLSGGVDSSAVVAMMARIGGGTVKTFSIGFSAKRYDETYYARMVAQRYATEHQELVVEPDAVAVLPRLVWHYGEPFADPSAIPTYYVSEVARRKVTVALNGDGGDECFFGYNRYRAMHLVSRLDPMSPAARIGLERLLALTPRWLQRRARVGRIRDVLQAPKEQPFRRYAPTIIAFTDRHKEDGYSELMRAQREGSAIDRLEPYFAEAGSLASAANWADLHTYLPDDLMVKVDVASMAHGLEARSPLLDHVLMEWAAEIPAELRMAHGVTKALFKSAMEPYLPTELLYRPKMGFSPPVDEWLRSELKELAYDTLLSHNSTKRGLFRREYVERLLSEHSSLVRDHHPQLWVLLMLELWFQMWIDAPRETEISRPAVGAHPALG